jgi:hypothetical protein
VSERVADREAEALRAAYEAALEDGWPDDADLDRIWGAVAGELPPAARREVVDEVARNPSWAVAWRIAHELAQGAAESAAPRPAPPRRWGPLITSLALAAGLLLAVGLGFLLRPSPPGPKYRDRATAAIESRTPGDVIAARDGCRLRWAGPAGAVYELRMTSEDLSQVRTASGLGSPEYRVPRDLLSALPPGSRLLWQVESRLPGGGRLASATFVATFEEECRS